MTNVQMTVIRYLVRFCLGSIIMLSASLGYAITTVTVSVTVMAGTCSFNDGKSIDVDFGNDVVTTKVDGTNYSKPLNINLKCDDLGKNTLKLQVGGTAAGFGGTNVIRTDNTNLGVAIKNNGIAVALDSNINFTYPTMPSLTAVLVNRPGTALGAGKFSGAATIAVDYQ